MRCKGLRIELMGKDRFFRGKRTEKALQRRYHYIWAQKMSRNFPKRKVQGRIFYASRLEKSKT